jgi:hypothetical protein
LRSNGHPKNLTSKQQVIIGTSEKLERLARILNGTEARLTTLPSFILQPMRD